LTTLLPAVAALRDVIVARRPVASYSQDYACPFGFLAFEDYLLQVLVGT
jgi:hypothetical protein